MSGLRKFDDWAASENVDGEEDCRVRGLVAERNGDA